MRIAQVAPLWEPVPPKKYGGTELVVHLLTEELVRLGHDVTLFASGDSITSARLVSATEGGYRLNKMQNCNFHDLRIIEQVMLHSNEFDIIHNHLGPQLFPFASLMAPPLLTTQHNAFKPKSYRECYQLYPRLPIISISDYQRNGCPELHYAATIYHGLALKTFTPSYTYEDKHYLVFLGRFSQEKGPHHAIRVARETGWKLIMAGKIDRCDLEFYREHVEPQIDGEQIQFVGEVDHAQKVALMRNAAVTLCPITWPEPFGLVIAESMACGTPVLAMRNGSVPELIEHGRSGFIADTVEEMIGHVSRIPEIDRRYCRDYAESRFSVERMTEDYLKVYEWLIEKSATNEYHPEASWNAVREGNPVKMFSPGNPRGKDKATLLFPSR
jgi:glycosyltransferase involved in cell wall biosynthesis